MKSPTKLLDRISSKYLWIVELYIGWLLFRVAFRKALTGSRFSLARIGVIYAFSLVVCLLAYPPSCQAQPALGIFITWGMSLATALSINQFLPASKEKGTP